MELVLQQLQLQCTKQVKTDKKIVNLLVEGGNLEVSFSEENGTYKNIFLTGKAEFVFSGTIKI